MIRTHNKPIMWSMRNQRPIKLNISLRRFFDWKIFLVALISYFFCAPSHAAASNPIPAGTTSNSFGTGNVLNPGDSLTVSAGAGLGVLNANSSISAVLFAPGNNGTTNVTNAGIIQATGTNSINNTLMGTTAGGNFGAISINNSGIMIAGNTNTSSPGNNVQDTVALNLTAASSLSGNISFTNTGIINGELRFPFSTTTTPTTTFTMNGGTLAYRVPNGLNTGNLLDASNGPTTRSANSTLLLSGGSIQGRIAGFNTFNIATNFSTGGGSDPGTITDTPNINVNSGTFTVNHAITNNTTNPVVPTAFVIANGATVQTTVANVLPATGTTTINATGNLNLNGNAQIIGDLVGAGNINTGGSTGTLTLGTANTAAIYTGTISGSGGLTKQNNGTQTLSTANNYTGTTTISNGILIVGNNTSLGSGTISFNGGALQSSNAVALANPFTVANNGSSIGGAVNLTLNGNGALGNNLLTINNTAGTIILGGTLSDTGNGSITQNGLGGTLTVSGSNSYAGTTTLTNGTLNANNVTNPLGTGPLALNGGTLQQTIGGTVTLGNSSFTVGAAGSTIGGAGNLTFNNAGTLTGALTVSNTQATVFNAGLGGIGSLNVSAGTVSLVAVNGYSGGTTITGGTLQTNNPNIMPSNGVVTIQLLGTLNLNGNNQTIGDLVGAGNITTAVSAGVSAPILTLGTANATAIYTGTISGPGGLTKQGNGTQTLSSATINNYSGNTTVSAGTLATGAANVLSNNSSVSVASGATLSLGAGHNQTVADLLSGTGTIDLFSSTLSFGSANTTAVFNGTIANSTGSGGITKLGTGTQTLATANTYTGTTTISNGILIVGNNTSLGSGTISFNGGALQSSNAVALANPFTVANNGSSIGGAVNLTLNGNGALGNNLLTINNTAGTIILGGTLSDTGNGSITQNGLGGTLTISGPNNYAGTTTLTNGTLNANNITNPLGTGPLVLNGGTLQQTIGGTVTLGNSSFTVGAAGSTIGGAGNLTFNNAGTLTGALTVSNTQATVFNAGLGGTGSLNVSAGTVSLVAANGYSGGTTITGGTLQTNNPNIMPSNGVVTIQLPGTLNLNGNAQTIGDLVGAGNVALGTATLTLGTATPSTTFSGIISGSGGIVKQGSGTWIVTRANNYSGGTIVNAGTLQGNTNSLQGAITNNATLIFDQAVTGTYGGSISGLGTILKGNIGNVIFSGNNSCTSAIIDNGRLSVNGILTGRITVNQSGTLGGVGTINGDVINNGMVQPGNSIGTLAINGDYKPGENSITSIEINSLGQTSLLKISGNAALNGTLSVTADPGVYIGGTAYKFLTASRISGSFTAVTPTILGPFKIVVFQRSPTVMEIVLQRTNIILGLNGANNNQIAIGNYIDGLPMPALGSDLGDNVIGPLGNLIEGQNLFDALESISPGKNAANSVVVQDINVLVNSINAARLSSLCHPPATQKIHSPTFSLLSIKPHEEKIGAWRQRRFHSTHNGLTADAANRVQPLLQTNGAKGGGWIYSFGHFADPNANSTDPGYDSKTGGAVVGLDISPYENIFVGLGVGYAGTILSFDNDFGKNMIDNYFGTFYAAWTPNDWRFNTSIVAGTVRFKTDQHIQFLSVNRHATADHKGIEATPHIGMGYEFAYNNMCILPFINVDYSYVHEEGYELQNALSLVQDIKKKSSGLLRSEAGIKITGHYDFDNRISGTWMPNASLSVVNKKIIKRGLTTAGFINQPGNFSVEYFTGTKNLISPGVGVVLQLSNSAFLELRGDSELGKRYRAYELSLKMGILF